MIYDRKILKELEKINETSSRTLHLLERHFAVKHATKILIIGVDTMNDVNGVPLNVVPGGSALIIALVALPANSIFDSPADLDLTADDPNVVIAPAPGDTTGTMFAVSAPASDTQGSAAAGQPGSFNLDASGLAGGVTIEGTANVTLSGEVVAPSPATSIGFQVVTPSAPSSGIAPAARRAAAAVPAVGNRRAPARS